MYSVILWATPFSFKFFVFNFDLCLVVCGFFFPRLLFTPKKKRKEKATTVKISKMGCGSSTDAATAPPHSECSSSSSHRHQQQQKPDYLIQLAKAFKRSEQQRRYQQVVVATTEEEGGGDNGNNGGPVAHNPLGVHLVDGSSGEMVLFSSRSTIASSGRKDRSEGTNTRSSSSGVKEIEFPSPAAASYGSPSVSPAELIRPPPAAAAAAKPVE